MKPITFIFALALVGVLLVGELGRSPAGRNAARRAIDDAVSGRSTLDYLLVRQMGTNALPQLLQAASMRESQWRQVYILIWSKLPNYMSVHLPQLLPAEEIRANAATILGELGPVAKPAVCQLARLLQDEVAGGNAALSLGQLGPDAIGAVPALIVALQEQRPCAATALGEIGEAAREARPNLEAAVRRGPEWLRRESSLALRKIGHG